MFLSLKSSGLGTVNYTEQHSIFPHFPSDLTPFLVRPSHTQQQWAPQKTRQSPSGHRPGPGPSLPRVERPCSAQISALRNRRTQSPEAQWRIQIGITWGTLNIINVGSHPIYLKGTLVRAQTCIYKVLLWSNVKTGLSIKNEWTDSENVVCVYIYRMDYHSGIKSFFFWLDCAAWGILVPWPGIEPRPWQCKHWVSATGLPGNSLK